MNLIIRSPYYASRKSGPSSRCFPRISTRKVLASALFKPWALFKRQDLKIAVIGLTTDDTAKIGNPEYFTDIEFRKPPMKRSW
ncbi:protein UshA precursor [includes: UDP-sugar hydrolase; 5'-nucleotidase] [Escherichia coli]|nr:protein UshA precursor [includes: UDP-sugar hydrolase; 5'-nucleotidase] [Escherichia coli]